MAKQAAKIEKKKGSFHDRYKTGDTPWEIERADHNLIRQVIDFPIAPCRVLDVGCGTGNNTIWLAQQGFHAIGCDLSGLAIKQAEKKATRIHVDASFLQVDILKERVPGAPFDFVFDRGCFHCFREADEKKVFVKKVDKLLKPQGLWLSLIGNADTPPRKEMGPPQVTARTIVQLLEPKFEILSLVSGHFDSNLQPAPRNWVCLLRKR